MIVRVTTRFSKASIQKQTLFLSQAGPSNNFKNFIWNIVV